MHSNHTADLVLEYLPNGTPIWLKPAHTVRVIDDVWPCHDDSDRYWLTEKGRADLRRAEAEAWLFAR
jgi:hypothetical protein